MAGSLILDELPNDECRSRQKRFLCGPITSIDKWNHKLYSIATLETLNLWKTLLLWEFRKKGWIKKARRHTTAACSISRNHWTVLFSVQCYTGSNFISNISKTSLCCYVLSVERYYIHENTWAKSLMNVSDHGTFTWHEHHQTKTFPPPLIDCGKRVLNERSQSVCRHFELSKYEETSLDRLRI